MGDVSAEPSMEDILSSIKRIIAEDGEAGQPPRVRRTPRPATTASVPHDNDVAGPEVLELSDLAPVADDEYAEEAAPALEPPSFEAPRPEPIVSQDALASSRGSLNALTRMIGNSEPEATPAGDGKSVEAFVAELLRPMLREWLDAKLPELVEAMVAKEIARITNSR